MKLADQHLFNFLGWNTQGDLGPWTFYTAKDKGLVWFPKSPPLKPPSYLQTVQRNRFRLAAQLWRSLTPAVRQDWMDAANKAHLWIHGYNLFVIAAVKPGLTSFPTIERQSGITLAPV